MQYRRFPRIDDLEVSALGFGCMRLPTVGGDDAAIDEDELRRRCSPRPRSPGSITLDTAYPYHGQASETALGAALERSGRRGKFQLATKCPVWLVKQRSDWDRYLDEQLAKLRTDHVDFYLLHALGTERWAKIKELGRLARPRARQGRGQDKAPRLLLPRLPGLVQGDHRRLRRVGNSARSNTITSIGASRREKRGWPTPRSARSASS